MRVIAATNRDLAEEVRKGRFREDLYYRLNVFPIRVPPLRERAEDIPLLVWTFLEEFSSRMGKKITQVPRKTMEALQRHPWPGNVRELRNVIEHGAIITTGDTLRVPMLDDAAPAAAPPQTLADAEREHILRALESTGWRIKGPKGAAAALGLNPSTLYSRMKKLGIRPPGGRRRAAPRSQRRRDARPALRERPPPQVDIPPCVPPRPRRLIHLLACPLAPAGRYTSLLAPSPPRQRGRGQGEGVFLFDHQNLAPPHPGPLPLRGRGGETACGSPAR